MSQDTASEQRRYTPMIPKLPCGHDIAETSRRYMRMDKVNFYTCRNIPGEQEGCEPAQQYFLEPMEWHLIVPRKEFVTPQATEEERSLRERLQAMVKERMKKRKVIDK